jgi:hypothetical protein
MTTKLNLRGSIWAYHEKLQSKDPDDKCFAVFFQFGGVASAIVFIAVLLCNAHWFTALLCSMMTFMITAFMPLITIAQEDEAWCPKWYYKIFRMSPEATFAMVLFLFVLAPMMIWMPDRNGSVGVRLLLGFNILCYLATTLYLLLTTPMNKHFSRKTDASVGINN